MAYHNITTPGHPKISNMNTNEIFGILRFPEGEEQKMDGNKKEDILPEMMDNSSPREPPYQKYENEEFGEEQKLERRRRYGTDGI